MFMSEQVLLSAWIYSGWSLILEYISVMVQKLLLNLVVWKLSHIYLINLVLQAWSKNIKDCNTICKYSVVQEKTEDTSLDQTLYKMS